MKRAGIAIDAVRVVRHGLTTSCEVDETIAFPAVPESFPERLDNLSASDVPADLTARARPSHQRSTLGPKHARPTRGVTAEIPLNGSASILLDRSAQTLTS